MNNTFLRFIMILICSILPLSILYADQNFFSTEKTYVLRITSLNPKNPSVPFTGSYVVTGKNGYRVIHFFFEGNEGKPILHINTPYEETIKGTALSTMVVSINDPQVDNVKVEILEKQEGKENSIMSGSGLTIVSTNDANLVFNNIYSK